MDEPRKPRQLDRQKHRRSRRSARDFVDPADKESSQQDLVSSTRQRSETEGARETSDDQDSLPELKKLTSSSSADSMVSTPSDVFSMKLRELEARVKSEDDRNLLRRIEQHIHDKDREMKKAVTTIAKMHKADNQKRDDRYFVKSTKTLRVLVENWSKRQRVVGASSKPDIIRFFNASSSAYGEILRSVGPRDPSYLSAAGDMSALMQAYLWLFLEQEVFGKFRWAGDPETYIKLEAVISPRK